MSAVQPHIAIALEPLRIPDSRAESSMSSSVRPLFGATRDDSDSSVDDTSGTPLTMLSRVLDHWFVVALPGVYAIVVAALCMQLSWRSMVMLVAVLTPVVGLVQLGAVAKGPCDVPPGRWTRNRKCNWAVWPLSIVVCFAGLGMVSWITVSAQYV